MYEQASPLEKSQSISLQRRYIQAKRRRLTIEEEVRKTTSTATLLRSKIDRENIRHSIFSNLYNRFYVAAEVRKEKEEDHRTIEAERRATLESLKWKTYLAKSNRDCRARQIRHSVLTEKSTKARLDKSVLSDRLNQTVEEQKREVRSKMCQRQRQMLDATYRIENITSKEVQLLYLRAVDNHKKSYHERLIRRDTLLRLKDDLCASGLHRRSTTE